MPSTQDEMTQALDALARGECIAIPTETVYGLAADATNGEAVARIFEMKGRPKFNPLICHVSGLPMALDYGQFDVISRELAMAFWPGPLTLVVKTVVGSDLHPLVTAGLETVGLRCPKGIAQDLIRSFTKPLAAPSANRSGRISPTSATHVRAEFPGETFTILDNGPCDVGLESTIMKVEGERIYILRPGAITAEMIKEATGITPEAPKSGKIEAPGMMASHYAPNARVVLNCTECPEGAAWLQFGDAPQTSLASRNLSRDSNLREAAANLYGCLKELDAMATETICVSPIPEEGLGVAINDRLRRAAAPRDNT